MDRINCRLSVKSVLVGVFSLFSLFFFSCENFMDSSVKDEIVNDIYIANNECPVAKVEEPVFSDMGVAKDKAIIISFTVSVDPKTFEKNYKLTDTYGNDLKSYYLKPVWSKNNKQVTLAPDKTNLIKLEENSTLDIILSVSKECKTDDNLPLKEAVNHKFRINNKIDGNEFPVATVVSPVYKEDGVEKNTAIIISFSVPVNPDTFETSFSIKDSAGYDLKSKFMTPKWSNDNKMVTISADEQNYIEFSGDLHEIIVKLDTNCKTDNNLQLKEAVNYKYKINNKVDNQPPVIAETTYAERPPISFNNTEISSAKKLKEGEITNESETEICKTNHINSSVTFYIEGSDYGGGAVKGHIICRQIAEVVGTAVKGAVRDFVFDLTKQTGSENYSGNYTLDLSSQDYEDGLYEVKLYVQDSSGVDSKEHFIYNVIRDTSLAYSINSRMVNDTPYFRDDIPEPTPDAQDGHWEPGEYESKSRTRAFNSQTPKIQLIEDFRKRILFDKLNDDYYYTSILTSKTYTEKDLTYFVSWGLDKEHLSTPEKIEGQFYIENSNIAPDPTIKYYNLPTGFYNFLNEHTTSDIILKAIVLDCVGNQSEIYSLWPKIIDFYNYTVEDDDNNKKKVKLNFSTLPVNDPFEDKMIHGKCRIFYAPLAEHAENDDLSNIVLKRNCDGAYIQFSDKNDLCEISGLQTNTKYVVYIQTAYDSDSIYNGQYNCTTFGPLKKLIVDTNKKSAGTPQKPTFTVEKVKGEKNSGLYTLNINITSEETLSNVRYIPYYYDVIKLAYWDTDLGNTIPDEWGWLKLETQTEKKFNITVNNQLRAPLKKGELWDDDKWDYTDYGNGNKPDNNYFQAVENCKSLGYTPHQGKIKIVAVNDTDSTESDEVFFDFNREDDTIPPKISSEITKHDSHLSFDGHCFEFTDLIREDEGNLTEYFTYYYTQYNPAWGDNLNVLSEDQIKMLPSGRAPYTGSCWLDDTNGAEYRLDTSIPVFGLPDGEYMYFAKLEDRFGNYTYTTLGKAHIGTFKNKLKVKLDDEDKYFVSTLELEPEESSFDRNLINVQVCYGTRWDNYYEWLNEIQNCVVKTDGGKTILYSNIGDSNDPNKFMYRNDDDPDIFDSYDLPKNRKKIQDNPEKWVVDSTKDRVLDKGQWYRITMQSYNENNDVNLRYGRPYTNTDPKNLWNTRLGWVDGEQKYDYCTEETVSNTVYYYVPWENGNDKEDFSDYYASFFSGTATPRSNHSMLVNVLVSNRDLGQDPDEWERRGKLVSTHVYKDWNDTLRIIDCDFNQSVAAEDVSKAREQGLVYYAAVVHFANGESAVSDVFTMYGF